MDIYEYPLGSGNVSGHFCSFIKTAVTKYKNNALYWSHSSQKEEKKEKSYKKCRGRVDFSFKPISNRKHLLSYLRRVLTLSRFLQKSAEMLPRSIF